MSHTTRRTIILGGLALSLSGCTSKFLTYDGPQVTHLQMFKGDRTLFLYNDAQILMAYQIDLGFAPAGGKQFEGDGKTPEGSYTIDRRNPDSLFHLSIGISYPNEADIAYAAAQGREPGGDIFIHGVHARALIRLSLTGRLAVSPSQIVKSGKFTPWCVTARQSIFFPSGLLVFLAVYISCARMIETNIAKSPNAMAELVAY